MTDTTPAQTAVDELRALALRSGADGATVQRLLDDATTELTGRTVVHRHEDLRPARFVLRRHDDVTGISGEGSVADGVMWPDRTASVRWRGEHPSIVFWDRGRASVEFVHGHVGATEVRFLDSLDEPVDPAPTGPAPLALHRAIDRALTAPVACPDCGRTTPCRCAASRHDGRVAAILAAVTPWVRHDVAGGRDV
ncbi:hypothetical protein [Streptomyces niveus]|uniref:hypothetical protein n=1 Tax=Streptomyces niveus TaxID=193462 RepID=UPI0003C5EE60|nr:hypothetical protein [Streptomyces niveus]EST22801.1 hypothetical protein M877_28910 [Streptomyces niveus NCIMB 11891]